MLDRYRELLVLSQTLNFKQAADQLHMSQSSLTRHVAALERDLGFPLFLRGPVVLTREGQHFMAGIEKIVTDFDEIAASCRDQFQNSSSAIVLNMPVVSHSVWGDVIYESVSEMQRRYPAIPPPRFAQPPELTIEASLFAGEADIGVVFREPTSLPDGFSYVRLMELPLAVYFRKDSDLGGGNSLTLNEVSDRYLIRPTSLHLQTFFEAQVDIFQRNQIVPRYRIRDIEDFERIAFVLQADEIFFGNILDKGAIPKSWPIEGLPLKAQHASYPIFLLYRDDATKPMVKEFVALCQEVLAEHASEDGALT